MKQVVPGNVKPQQGPKWPYIMDRGKKTAWKATLCRGARRRSSGRYDKLRLAGGQKTGAYRKRGESEK